MRHGDKINNLSRTASHRKALLANLACQLIQYKRIVTTLAKAKALRVYVEPLLTKSKDNRTHQYRVVFSYLKDKEAVKELFTVISAKIASRPGGYTRIIKLGTRPGDNAEQALIELVDFNDVYGKVTEEKTEATKRTRRAGGRKKAGDAEVAPATTTSVAAETTAPETTTPETIAPVASSPVADTTAPEDPAAPQTNEEKQA